VSFGKLVRLASFCETFYKFGLADGLCLRSETLISVKAPTTTITTTVYLAHHAFGWRLLYQSCPCAAPEAV